MPFSRRRSLSRAPAADALAVDDLHLAAGPAPEEQLRVAGGQVAGVEHDLAAPSGRQLPAPESLSEQVLGRPHADDGPREAAGLLEQHRHVARDQLPDRVRLAPGPVDVGGRDEDGGLPDRVIELRLLPAVRVEPPVDQLGVIEEVLRVRDVAGGVRPYGAVDVDLPALRRVDAGVLRPLQQEAGVAGVDFAVGRVEAVEVDLGRDHVAARPQRVGDVVGLVVVALQRALERPATGAPAVDEEPVAAVRAHVHQELVRHAVQLEGPPEPPHGQPRPAALGAPGPCGPPLPRHVNAHHQLHRFPFLLRCGNRIPCGRVAARASSMSSPGPA